MAGEVAVDKKKVGILLRLETIEKAMKRFGLEGDPSVSVAVVRAVEEATRDVELDAEAYARISMAVAENMKKRRAIRAMKKGAK